MPKLILMRGYSGSGKTTLAKDWVDRDPENHVRVNRDDLRSSLFNQEGILSNDKEAIITKVQRLVATEALKAGKDVINDDTNLRRKFAVEWANLAKELDAEFEVYDCEISLEECLRRNHARMLDGGRYVPEDAIRNQAKKFPIGKWPKIEAKASVRDFDVEPYDKVKGIPTYIVDIDGTLADFTTSNHRGPFDFHKVLDDDTREDVIRVVEKLSACSDIIFLSGRDDSCFEDTRKWLDENVSNAVFFPLHMRKTGDFRPDYVIKYELFNQYCRDKNIAGCIDDRDQVVKLWLSLGLTVFNVGDGTVF